MAHGYALSESIKDLASFRLRCFEHAAGYAARFGSGTDFDVLDLTKKLEAFCFSVHLEGSSGALLEVSDIVNMP